MKEPRNQLLRASAGTGKTYRLTNRMLRLFLAGVEPERVLATTFTRKAAAEILDRVLERLVDATDSREGLEDLRSAVGDQRLSVDRCRALLVKLTRGLDTFQVRTIDSFFSHLVRLFALELELPPNWSIADEREDDALQREAMADVLASVEREEMIEILRILQDDAAGSGVEVVLHRLATELRPIALESEPRAWSALRRGDPVEPAAFGQARLALPEAPLAQTAKGEDDKRWVKSRAKIVAAIEAEDWRTILGGGLGAASLLADPEYCRKPFPPGLFEILAPIVAHAKFELLSQLAARTEAVHALLERFESCYAACKHAAGRYRFDDLPIALAPRTARAQLFDEREAELWFRLDSKIDHLLLDEFQDTSPVQWRILEPLATEITSADGDRSFFCVGDAKQSIYGFRQAEPRLLQELERLLPGLEPESMVKSYRSSSVVLELVNRVFGALEINSALWGEGIEPYLVAARSWSERFASHEAARDLPGVVHLLEAREPREGEAKHPPCIDRAVERVVRILAEAPHAEVGVLTRVNKIIPHLIHALRQAGIDASGEGGNQLTDSDAVLVYISLLHLADHPSDKAAAFHVRTSRFSAYIDLAPDADREAVHTKARWFRRELLGRGLGEVTANLARQVYGDPSWSAWDGARFAQLVDHAYAFEAQLSIRTSDFVDHLRKQRVEAPGGARVRVMTVHASKGLEFDAVILPDLDSKLVGPRDAYLCDRPDPAGLITKVMLSPGKDLLMLSPELKQLYDATTAKAVEDSLCNLYVALTRAKRRVEVIVPWLDPQKDSRNVPTYATLVRGAFGSSELRAVDSEGVLWSSADNAAPDAWGEGLEQPETETAEPNPELCLAKTTLPRFARRRRASAEEGGARVRASDILCAGRGASVGTLVHAAFEGCEWVEDFAFDPTDLEGRGATAEVVQAARGIIASALHSEEIRAALSRDACTAPRGTELRVEREHEFSLLLEDAAGESQFWNGAIDRLVLAEAKGRVVWAEVIDFKSDRVDAGELGPRVEYYRPQLEAYARIVAAQTGLAADRVKLRLAFLSAGRVIEV